MNEKQHKYNTTTTKIKTKHSKKSRPVPNKQNDFSSQSTAKLQSKNDESKPKIGESPEIYESNDAFKYEVERFIEISKFFSSPLHKTASYICENRLISYPSSYRVEYRRGGVTTGHIKFSNITLEPVYVKLYKVIPNLEQIKYINLSVSRCKRIPPGLSFNLGFIYDDVNEKPACNAKMIFVASRKTTTPCYQICEIQLNIDVQKVHLSP